jgi:hypothetical protein
MIMIESESQRNYKDSKLLCYGTVVYRAGQDRTQRAKAGQGRKGQPGLRRMKEINPPIPSSFFRMVSVSRRTGERCLEHGWRRGRVL